MAPRVLLAMILIVAFFAVLFSDIGFFTQIFWMIVILFAISFSVVGIMDKASDAKVHIFDEAFEQLTNFAPSQKLISGDYRTAIALDQNANRICILTKQLNSSLNAHIIGYRDFLECEIVEDGHSVTKTSRSSQIGGAILGGILAGGVGAIVGGVSGKTSTTSQLDSIDLRIIVNNPNYPAYTINIWKNGLQYNRALYKRSESQPNFQTHRDVANYWYGVITSLIKKADREDQDKSNRSLSSSSVTDELRKVSELRDKGILSEEEFVNVKSKILAQTQSAPNSDACNHRGQSGKFCTECGQRIN